MDTIQSYFTLIVTLETSFIVLCLMIACCDYSEAKPIEHSMPRWFLFFFGQDFSFLFVFQKGKKFSWRMPLSLQGFSPPVPELWEQMDLSEDENLWPDQEVLAASFPWLRSRNEIVKLYPRPFSFGSIRVDEGKDLLKVVYGNIITNMVLKERSSNCLLVSSWFRIFIFKGIFVFPRKSNV